MATSQQEATALPNPSFEAAVSSTSNSDDSDVGFDVVSVADYQEECHRNVGLQPSMLVKKEQSPPVEVDRNVKEFIKSCEKIYKHLRLMHEGNLIPTKMWEEIEQTMSMLAQKEIMICVFGQQNCGKSTFINALLGDKFLPVNMFNCTALSIKIQHCNSIHPVCTDDCKLCPKYCPRLYETTSHSNKEITGREEINRYLSFLNDTVRNDPNSRTLEIPQLLLKVCIPFLGEGVPLGWTVTLMDNPGFGEACEYITQLADASMVTSCVYIYLMQTENIGGTPAVDYFKQLLKKDCAVSDGRLVIGITKIDQHLNDDDDCDISNLKQQLKDKVVSNFQCTTETAIPGEIIVPTYARLVTSSPFMWLMQHSPSDKKPKKVLDEIQKYNISILSGQDEDQEQAIMNCDPKVLLKELEAFSGMTEVKHRLQRIVGKACVRTWAQKLYAQFLIFCVDLQNHIQSLRSDISNSCEQLDRALNDIKVLKGNLEKEIEMESVMQSESWKKLRESYYQDIEVSEAPVIVKSVIDGLLSKFKEECQRKRTCSEFTSNEFKACVREFVSESRSEIQNVFDNCRFPLVDKCIDNMTERAVEQIAELKDMTRRLNDLEYPRCSTPVIDSMPTRGDEESHRLNLAHGLFAGEVENQIFQATLLYSPGDVATAKKASFNEPSDNGDRIATKYTLSDEVHTCDSDTSDGSDSDDECNEHKDITYLREMTSSGDVPKIFSWWDAIKDLWCHFIEKARNLVSDNTSDIEDVHEEGGPTLCTEETLSELAESLRMDASLRVMAQVPPCDSTNAASSNGTHQATNITEQDMPTDEGGAAMANSDTTWSDAMLLDLSINGIGNVMKDGCDQYLRKVAPSAIKSFHKKYRSKIEARLSRFEKKFKVSLESKTEEVEKMKRRISFIDQQDHQLFKLQKHLMEAWERIGFSLEGLSVKKATAMTKMKEFATTVTKSLCDLVTSKKLISETTDEWQKTFKQEMDAF